MKSKAYSDNLMPSKKNYAHRRWEKKKSRHVTECRNIKTA
jgi:hypothetical protein